jgi:type VI secretion system protein ImpF
MKSRARVRSPVLGSIIDRLSDDVEGPDAEGLSLTRLRDGLRRDLEGLLNTRRRFLSWPEELEDLDRSLLSYGLSDFTNSPIASDRFRKSFIEEVERLIAHLEPRISNFEVSIITGRDASDRVIRFRIVGLVQFGGEEQQISFDSHVDPVRCGVVVRG